MAMLFHFGAVVVRIIASPSGPWPTRFGTSTATPPQFAYDALAIVEPYLRSLRLSHDYHYLGNRPDRPMARLVWVSPPSAGSMHKQELLPDPMANMWVRHRQELLARWLADDQPVTPPIGEMIPAPNTSAPSALVWEPVGDRQLQLRQIPVHLIPRDQPVFRPSEISLVMARSYARHLARQNRSGPGRIARQTHEAIPPAILFEQNVPTDAFAELMSDFGAFQK